jgi:hypothetical protein
MSLDKRYENILALTVDRRRHFPQKNLNCQLAVYDIKIKNKIKLIPLLRPSVQSF